mmetsp:Transcript_2564/g.10247  ORF Transcript_2564/g.10247 Transcript_2564/m.10247 type:complete len:219 (+) Transcript_2564:1405-2061(+)
MYVLGYSRPLARAPACRKTSLSRRRSHGGPRSRRGDALEVVHCDDQHRGHQHDHGAVDVAREGGQVANHQHGGRLDREELGQEGLLHLEEHAEATHQVQDTGRLGRKHVEHRLRYRCDPVRMGCDCPQGTSHCRGVGELQVREAEGDRQQSRLGEKGHRAVHGASRILHRGDDGVDQGLLDALHGDGHRRGRRAAAVPGHARARARGRHRGRGAGGER